MPHAPYRWKSLQLLHHNDGCNWGSMFLLRSSTSSVARFRIGAVAFLLMAHLTWYPTSLLNQGAHIGRVGYWSAVLATGLPTADQPVGVVSVAVARDVLPCVGLARCYQRFRRWGEGLGAGGGRGRCGGGRRLWCGRRRLGRGGIRP